MSSKLRWDVSMNLEPVDWPAANSPRSYPETGAPRPRDTRFQHPASDGEQKAQAAYTQGHRDGVAAAHKEAEAQVRAIVERLAHSIDEITGMRQRLRHEAEEDMIALSIAI